MFLEGPVSGPSMFIFGFLMPCISNDVKRLFSLSYVLS